MKEWSRKQNVQSFYIVHNKNGKVSADQSFNPLLISLFNSVLTSAGEADVRVFIFQIPITTQSQDIL